MRSKYSFITYLRKDLLNAFYLASANGHLEKVKYLLTLPNVIKNVASSNNLALRLASENGHLNVVKLLLTLPEVVADAAASDNHAFRYAAENGHLMVVKTLLTIPIVRERAAINVNHALRWSSAKGHLDIVNCLLEIDEVANHAVLNDNHALRIAVYNKHHDVAARLLRVPAVLNYMKTFQPSFIEDNRQFFDEMLALSRARAIFSRKLGQQKVTRPRIPFDITVKILEAHSHAVICGKSKCDIKSWSDGQPYCTLVYSYARCKSQATNPQNVSNSAVTPSNEVLHVKLN